MADLFGQHDTLAAYFWMYGSQRERPCPMCTNWLGSVNGNAPDIEQRVSLRILGRSPVERQIAFADERGWRNLTFVQTIGDEWAHDLGLLNEDGTEIPASGYSARMAIRYACSGRARRRWPPPPRPGLPRRPRHRQLVEHLDLTPDGRGRDWYPKLRY